MDSSLLKDYVKKGPNDDEVSSMSGFTCQKREECESDLLFRREEDDCPICLNEFEEQWIAIPDGCSHIFCLDCILEWSKNSCTCPVDRIKFANLSVYEKVYGTFQHNVHVVASEVKEDSLDTVYCQICGSHDDEDTLLLCDECDLGYHCACLDPPLDGVPIGEWFCPTCQQQREVSSHEQVQSTNRALGRTRAVERVRYEIQESRNRRSNTGDLRSQIYQIVDDILSRSAASLRIIESNCNENRTVLHRARPRKGKRKRQKRSTRCTKQKFNGFVSKTNSSDSALGRLPSSTLHLFGNDAALDNCSSQNVDETPSLIAKKHRKLSTAAMRFGLPLPSLFSMHRSDMIGRSTQQPITDLLGHILQEQKVLSVPSHQLHIERNGTLQIPKCKSSENAAEKHTNHRLNGSTATIECQSMQESKPSSMDTLTGVNEKLQVIQQHPIHMHDSSSLGPVQKSTTGNATTTSNHLKLPQHTTKAQFQQQVAEEAKLAIKSYFERRQINKAEYKEIMKRTVNKVCSSEGAMQVNTVKITRLIRQYVRKYRSERPKE